MKTLKCHNNLGAVSQILINIIELLFAGCLDNDGHRCVISAFAGFGFYGVILDIINMTFDDFNNDNIQFRTGFT